MQIKIEGLPQLQTRLQRVVDSMGSLQPTFRKVGEVMTKFYSTQPFLSQGGVYGEHWAPLSAKYEVKKERAYPGRGILVASGKMMDSFKAEATNHSVTITNTSELFAYHQMGTSKMPQRVSMMLDEQRRQLAMKTISADLKIRIKEAW